MPLSRRTLVKAAGTAAMAFGAPGIEHMLPLLHDESGDTSAPLKPDPLWSSPMVRTPVNGCRIVTTIWYAQTYPGAPATIPLLQL